MIVNVSGVNDAPDAVDDQVTLNEDETVFVEVLVNDSDRDSPLAYATLQIIEQPSHGTAEVGALGGRIEYTPNANFFGSDRLTYVVQDTEGATSNVATVAITVLSVNDAPVAAADSVILLEDVAHAINVLGNDTDVDGQLVTSSVSIVTAPQFGSVVVNPSTGSITYTPDDNFYGQDSFAYRVQDNDGEWSNAATVTLTVESVNDAPLANNDAATLDEDTEVTIDLLANDSDIDGLLDPGTLVLTQPTHGEVEDHGDGTVTYRPAANYFGSDQFRYTVQDNEGAVSNSATVTLTINPVNDAPEIEGTPEVSVDQDGTYRFVPAARDVEGDTALTFRVQNLPYWATFNEATGELSGTPGNDDVGVYENIIVSVSDGVNTTVLDAFDITVVNLNDAPQAVADRYRLAEGGILEPGVAEGVITNDIDIDGDRLTATLETSPRNAAEFTLNADGSFRYVHNGSETVVDSFSYRVSDGELASETVLVNLTIEPVNDMPRFVSHPVLAVSEGAEYEYAVAVNDPDSVLELTLVEGPEWLSLVNGRLFGAAPFGEIGTQSVLLQASDGQYSVDQAFTLTVIELNTPGLVISTEWIGMPGLVDRMVDLSIRVEHAAGPALTSGSLNVQLSGLDVDASMESCASASDAFRCDLALAEGESQTFRLRVTPQVAGSLIVNVDVESQGDVIAQAITDASIAEGSVSRGNVSFSLARATTLASINLLDDGTLELVAGTIQGESVKLLNYNEDTQTSNIIGEIPNLGYNQQVLVADVDQDGLDDIVVINRQGDASAVYYDRGGEFLVEPASQAFPYAGSALLEDLNQDGYPELIVGGNGVHLYIYENKEGIYEQAPLVFTATRPIRHFALMKSAANAEAFSGTLALVTTGGLQLVSFARNPDGVLERMPLTKAGSHALLAPPSAAEPDANFTVLHEMSLSGVSALRLADVDGDGREEMIVGIEHSHYSAELSGVLVIAVDDNDQLHVLRHLNGASVRHVELGDFNGDQRLDLLVINHNNSYQFYYGTGDGTVWTLSDTILYHNPHLVLADDINNDGLTDVLTYEESRETLEIYLSSTSANVGSANDLVLQGVARAISANRHHVEFTATVMNHGPTDARNVVVTVALPANVSVLNLPQNCLEDRAGSQVICSVPSILVDQSRSIAMTLSAEGDASVTAYVVADELEMSRSDNELSISLSAMFENKRARVKGGGSLDGSWILALLGLALIHRRTRREIISKQMKSGVWQKAAAVLLPCFAVAAVSPESAQAEAKNTSNSYVEGTLGVVNSDWQSRQFYFDLVENTQHGVLTEKDANRAGWQLLYGYRLHPKFAVEVGYMDSGTTELEVDATVSDPQALREVMMDHAPISGEGLYAGIRLSAITAHDQEFYLRLGMWSWSAGYTLQIDDQAEWISRDGEDWLWGVGVNIPLSEKFKAGATFQKVSLDGNGLTFVGLNLLYQFDVRRAK